MEWQENKTTCAVLKKIQVHVVNLLDILANERYVVKYRILNFFGRNMGIDERAGHGNIVVSLTSYRKRINSVHLTIESLMRQKVKPWKIVLWLSKEDLVDGKLPKKIINLKRRGLIVRIVDENFRSYKKLVYAAKEYKENYILTCDDDVVYFKDFVEGLHKHSMTYPDCVVGYRCKVIKKKSKNELAPYSEWRIATESKPSHDIMPTGVGGVLYPPGSLHEDIANSELFLKLAPLNDDIWFKAMTLLTKTQTVMIQNEKMIFPTIFGTQSDALWKINVDQNGNDLPAKKIFDHYDLYDLIE